MCSNYNFCIPPAKRDVGMMVFIFGNFSNFINKIGEISEKENHHPDISFGWGYAKIAITTHAIEGLSENDFILAAKIDQIFNV